MILPCAWELINDNPYELYTLKVPNSWKQVAQSLAKKRSQSTKNYPSIPVKSLDPIIYASYPKIVHVARKSWKNNNNPWLYSQDKIDTELLSYVLKDWLEEEFNESLGEENVRESLKNLKAEDWQWDEKPISYSLINANQQYLYPDIRFKSVPDYLVTEFLKNPTINFGKKGQYPLTFHRVVRLNSDGELMSWPPKPLLIGTKTDSKTVHISFVIKFTLQTIPFRKHPLITYQLSVRRWIYEFPKGKFPYRGVTAFVGNKMRWLDGEKQPFSFVPLQIKKIGENHQWQKVVNRLLGYHNVSLPQPQDLLKTPEYQWQNPEQTDDFQIAISYDNRHLNISHCSPGVNPIDYVMVDKAIEERLPVQRVGQGIKIAGNKAFWKPSPTKSKDDKTPKKPDELDPPIFRPSVAAPAVFSLNKCPLKTILILWETTETRDELIKEICLRLQLTIETKRETNEENYREIINYQGELGEICIITQHVQELTNKLDIDKANKRKNGLCKRAKNIQKELPYTEEICGCLIEIKDKNYFFKLPASDPKLALRIGAGKANYLNQHLHSISKFTKEGKKYFTKDGENRIKQAVSDLLRQFGVFPLPSNQTGELNKNLEQLDKNLWLTCFYVLRRTKKTNVDKTSLKIAVMVRVNPITGSVEIANSSSYSESIWEPYPKGLLTLLNLEWDENSTFEDNTSYETDDQSYDDKKEQKNKINQFVEKCLKSCLSEPLETDKPHLLFMVEAQNSRKVLPYINNKNLSKVNQLPKEIKLNSTDIENQPETERIQIVRLRINKNGEVPHKLAVKDNQASESKTTGVFRWDNVCDSIKNNLFISLRQNLNTEQNLLRIGQSRLDDGTKATYKVVPLEISIIYNPKNNNEELAAFVHYLRSLWPYYSNETTLPFPFPFAQKAKEYAVTYTDDIELEPIEEDEQPEEQYNQLTLFDLKNF